MLLRFLPPVLGVAGAIAGVTMFTAIALSSRKPYYGAERGITQAQIDGLRYFAFSRSCSKAGCALAVKQSSRAIHTRIGFPFRFDAERDYYPIAGGDGITAQPVVVVSYRNDPDRGYKPTAYEIWIPARRSY